ncbi:MAG: hypothetical protein FWD22_05270 [Treponema sp.]|nr:hypothetical protein [Treponema sp.]
MRKPLASRLIGLAALYCVIFCLIVILQFSNKGSFSISAGAMTIRGSYSQSSQITPQEALHEEAQDISGGVKVFYGGLEFNLKEERGKGLILMDINGINRPVNPELMIITDNIARFILPGGTTLTFNSIDSAGSNELQIYAEFAANISEITIPVIPRRSSLVRDSGQLGIMFAGSRYVFSSLGQELENGYLSLSRDNTFISYRSRGRQRAFDPADYIITQVQNYDRVLRTWQDTNFVQWNQNAANLNNEDDIIAYSAQSLLRGNYAAATEAISRDFINSPRQSYRSAGFIGGMSGAYTSFLASENDRMNQITRLIRERSLNILKQEHILNFLFTRSNLVLANEVIDIIYGASPDMLISDYCPGLLEAFYDIRRWRPEASNIIDHLSDQILVLVSENINRDTDHDAVYASSAESNNSEYSLRLGKALVFWADTTQNTEWSGIGKSLILSAISSGNAGRLHNILNPADYYPRETWLTNEGHWAWTVSPSVRASYIEGNLNFAVSFPPNMSHHLIIRGVRPFIRIQIHGMDWRSDSQFERYDSSGWVYYPENQILILKLRHRTTVENVRLIYRIEEPRPVVEADTETETNPGVTVE